MAGRNKIRGSGMLCGVRDKAGMAVSGRMSVDLPLFLGIFVSGRATAAVCLTRVVDRNMNL